MVEPKTDALMKSVENLVAEKQAVTSKEKELIEGSNAASARWATRWCCQRPPTSTRTGTSAKADNASKRRGRRLKKE